MRFRTLYVGKYEYAVVTPEVRQSEGIIKASYIILWNRQIAFDPNSIADTEFVSSAEYYQIIIYI